MRKLLVLAVVTSLLAAAVPALAATKKIPVGDNFFVQASGVPTVKVKRGTTVKWVWKGSSPHNVRVTKGPKKFASPVKTSGSYKRKLTKRGTYRIVCDVHGGADQSMKLVVR